MIADRDHVQRVIDGSTNALRDALAHLLESGPDIDTHDSAAELLAELIWLNDWLADGGKPCMH